MSSHHKVRKFAQFQTAGPPAVMSLVGHMRTSSTTSNYVRYWGLSRHPMSAFGRDTLYFFQCGSAGMGTESAVDSFLIDEGFRIFLLSYFL